MIKKGNAKFSNPQGGAAIKVRVNTKAKKNTVKHINAEGLVSIDLVSEDAAINNALSSFLADMLNVSSNEIEILEGGTIYDKVVCVLGKDVESVNQILKKQ